MIAAVMAEWGGGFAGLDALAPCQQTQRSLVERPVIAQRLFLRVGHELRGSFASFRRVGRSIPLSIHWSISADGVMAPVGLFGWQM